MAVKVEVRMMRAVAVVGDCLLLLLMSVAATAIFVWFYRLVCTSLCMSVLAFVRIISFAVDLRFHAFTDFH